MEKRTLEANGKEYPCAVVESLPTKEEYEELEEEGYQTRWIHVDDNGNDYWDLEVWFPKEGVLTEQEERRKVKEDLYNPF